MRIIMTSLLSPWDPRHGGGQLCTHNLAVALCGRGHAVTVIYTSEAGARPADIPGDLPYEAEFLPHHGRLYVIPRDFAKRLRKPNGGVHVIHTTAITGAFLPNTSGSPRPAVVATTHHPDPPDLSDPPGWGRPLDRAKWSRRHVLALLERRTLQRSDTVVCTSHHSARILRERGYIDASTDLRVVHNGSPAEDIERSAPIGATQERDDRTLPVLCVARLDEHKGIDVLFRALSQLGELPVCLDLVGAGQAEGTLREEANRLGIASRIRWHGYASRDRVRALLAEAEVLVLPSRSENFPLVILEALHAGLPIVATTAGGIPEAVRDGKEALLVEPDDVGALAGALRRVVLDEQLRRKLAAAAAERADEFTWRRTAERVEQIYLELRG